MSTFKARLFHRGQRQDQHEAAEEAGFLRNWISGLTFGAVDLPER
jgi:hypothetical protein